MKRLKIATGPAIALLVAASVFDVNANTVDNADPRCMVRQDINLEIIDDGQTVLVINVIGIDEETGEFDSRVDKNVGWYAEEQRDGTQVFGAFERLPQPNRFTYDFTFCPRPGVFSLPQFNSPGPIPPASFPPQNCIRLKEGDVQMFPRDPDGFVISLEPLNGRPPYTLQVLEPGRWWRIRACIDPEESTRLFFN